MAEGFSPARRPRTKRLYCKDYVGIGTALLLMRKLSREKKPTYMVRSGKPRDGIQPSTSPKAILQGESQYLESGSSPGTVMTARETTAPQ